MIRVVALVASGALATAGYAEGDAAPVKTPVASSAKSVYVLGPDDSVSIWVLGLEEISDKPVRIDFQGFVDIPLVGRVKASGLTVDQFKASLAAVLSKQVKTPQVTVNVVEFRSQPVSVVGEVNAPGVHQLQGRKTLMEMISMAGGLRQTAGYSVRITRRSEWGPIPLPDVKTAPGSDYSVAEVNLRDLMAAANPEQNISILPNDVISVPRAGMFYVLGDVKKAGAFVMGEKTSISVLQALSTAEGALATASTGHARILRAMPGQSERVEMKIDLKKLLAGKGEDPRLHPEDILYVPSSTTKKITTRAIEGSISLGTGLLVWR
jgi:polysaccharide export outer membrane protein